MALGTNHWKLGLFVIVGLVLSVASLAVLGARNWNQASVRYVSYFDESVQGLEIGSPVKFRGVSVGRVAAIDIGPDQRHVEVTSELDTSHVERLKFAPGAPGESGKTLSSAHPDLRVQLAQAGITGVKFLLLDYFDPEDHPLVELPFAVPENYLPATESVLQNLQNSVVKTADHFPDMAADAAEVLTKLNLLMTEIDRGRLPERAVATFDQANRTLHVMEGELAGLNAAGISKEVRHTLVSFNVSLERANKLMDRLDSEQGLLGTAQRSLGALGEVARGAQSLGGELELTLRDVRGAARSIQRFADALERDPDMLLKGRAARSE